MTRWGLTPEERFWLKVKKSEACWEWTAFKNHHGYGRFTPIQGNGMQAHRYSFILANGDIPAGLFVDHICRNKGCVRPDHLRLATPAENTEHQNGHRDSRSGRRGVAYHTRSGKWLAKATKGGVTYTAGLHDDVEVAAEAARQLRLDLFTRNELDKKDAA